MTEIENMNRTQIEAHLVSLQAREELELRNNRLLTTTYKDKTLLYNSEENCTDWNFEVKIKIMRDNPDDILIRIPNGVHNPDVKEFLVETMNVYTE